LRHRIDPCPFTLHPAFHLVEIEDDRDGVKALGGLHGGTEFLDNNLPILVGKDHSCAAFTTTITTSVTSRYINE
jgi:hypothetical protein